MLKKLKRGNDIMNKIKIAFNNLYTAYCKCLITEEQYKVLSAIVFENLKPVEIQTIVTQVILLK